MEAGRPGAADDAREQPRERGWGRTLLAVLAALAVTAAALWPPAVAPAAAVVRVLVPVQEAMLLVVPALAACALVGWWAGGRLALALLWLGIAAVVLVLPMPARAPGYTGLARGWALLLAGAFGGACALGTPRGGLARRGFVGRGLVAVALAFAAGGAALTAGGREPSTVAAAGRAELQRRADASLAVWRRHARRSPAWRGAAGAPAVRDVARRATAAVDQVAALPAAAGTLLPALLGLESLAALALAWSLYHRFSRTRLGAPLAPVAAFRFNDQLVWGVVAGATFVVLPNLSAFRAVGLNLLAFFGALYALRGLGVLRWWAAGWLVPAGAAGAVLAAALLVPLLGVTLPLAVLGAAALALGLGDTLGGWRTRPGARAASIGGS